jgi:Cytochrome c7 and related cytochrome c
MPEPGEEIAYPAEAKCMKCHTAIKAASPAIQKLAAYDKDHQPVPWVQVYSLPDFVFFSHRTHIEKGKVRCETCHGPVAEREVITRERDISMKVCVDCHIEQHARVACNTCHSPHP